MKRAKKTFHVKSYIILLIFILLPLITSIIFHTPKKILETDKKSIEITVSSVNKETKEITDIDNNTYQVEGVNYNNVKEGYRLSLEKRIEKEKYIFSSKVIKEFYQTISVKEPEKTDITAVSIIVKDYKIDDNKNTVIKDDNDKEYILKNDSDPLRPTKGAKITLYKKQNDNIYHISNNFK